jgi:hypothetical protein
MNRDSRVARDSRDARDTHPPETGVSPGDLNRAAVLLAERKPSLMSLRADEVAIPRVSVARALGLSAHIQTLARDMAGPYPFQFEFFDEVVRLAQGSLLDDALAFYAADMEVEASLNEEGRRVKSALIVVPDEVVETLVTQLEAKRASGVEHLGIDLWRRAYTYWAVNYDKVVRVGRFFAELPRTWPLLTDPEAPPITLPHATFLPKAR